MVLPTGDTSGLSATMTIAIAVVIIIVGAVLAYVIKKKAPPQIEVTGKQSATPIAHTNAKLKGVRDDGYVETGEPNPFLRR